MTHSPLPWRIVDKTTIVDANNKTVAITSSIEQSDLQNIYHAAIIVTAVNSYAADQESIQVFRDRWENTVKEYNRLKEFYDKDQEIKRELVEMLKEYHKRFITDPFGGIDEELGERSAALIARASAK